MNGFCRIKTIRFGRFFWKGGLTNPLSVIEQFNIYYLSRGLDDKQMDYD